MKTTVILILLGALVGVVAASYIVPPALSWYAAPGGLPGGAQIQTVVPIPEIIRYATGKLLRGQIIGGSLGAAVGLALGIFAGARSRRARLDRAAQTAPVTRP